MKQKWRRGWGLEVQLPRDRAEIGAYLLIFSLVFCPIVNISIHKAMKTELHGAELEGLETLPLETGSNNNSKD